MMVIEEATEMPTTASPLFLVGLAGGAFLALGGLLSGIRRRLSTQGIVLLKGLRPLFLCLLVYPDLAQWLAESHRR